MIELTEREWALIADLARNAAIDNMTGGGEVDWALNTEHLTIARKAIDNLSAIWKA